MYRARWLQLATQKVVKTAARISRFLLLWFEPGLVAHVNACFYISHISHSGGIVWPQPNQFFWKGGPVLKRQPDCSGVQDVHWKFSFLLTMFHELSKIGKPLSHHDRCVSVVRIFKEGKIFPFVGLVWWSTRMGKFLFGCIWAWVSPRKEPAFSMLTECWRVLEWNWVKYCLKEV